MLAPLILLCNRVAVRQHYFEQMPDLPRQAMVDERADPAFGELAEEEHVLADHADLVFGRLELEQRQEIAVALLLGLRLQRVEDPHVEQQHPEAEVRYRFDDAAFSQLARRVEEAARIF